MRKPKPPKVFDENPAWTDKDLARAAPFTRLPDELQEKLASVRRRGPQKSPTKVRTAIRLSRDVLAHFKAGGRGWQTRIDETLREVMASASKRATAARRRARGTG
ncbi:MAG: BrnA antitoxin family protein [Burkholderiales bacterium]